MKPPEADRRRTKTPTSSNGSSDVSCTVTSSDVTVSDSSGIPQATSAAAEQLNLSDRHGQQQVKFSCNKNNVVVDFVVIVLVVAKVLNLYQVYLAVVVVVVVAVVVSIVVVFVVVVLVCMSNRFRQRQDKFSSSNHHTPADCCLNQTSLSTGIDTARTIDSLNFSDINTTTTASLHCDSLRHHTDDVSDDVSSAEKIPQPRNVLFGDVIMTSCAQSSVTSTETTTGRGDYYNGRSMQVDAASLHNDDTTTTTTTTTIATTGIGDLDVFNVESTLPPEMNWDRLEEQLRNALQLEQCVQVRATLRYVTFRGFYPYTWWHSLRPVKNEKGEFW